MRDGKTRELARGRRPGLGGFPDHIQAKLVVVAGAAAGTELLLDRECVTLGRGPGVDLAFQDDAMSRQHAAVELTGEGFRVRDLGSRNGIHRDGERVQVCDLRHGDRFELGTHVLQLLIEEREQPPDVYEISAG
jgi:pSer/pThr/pTyr-binding forkhead associated (FHA) protein